MTEVEKMRNGLLADMSSPELQVRFEHAKKLQRLRMPSVALQVLA